MQSEKAHVLAEQIAMAQGATTKPFRVEDAWGGYWQVRTPHGPYNFRTTEDRKQGETT